MNSIPVFGASPAHSVMKRNELNKVVIDRSISDVYIILKSFDSSKKMKNRSLYNKTFKSMKAQLDVLNNKLQSDFLLGNLDSQGILNAYISRIEILKHRIKALFSVIS